MKKMIVAILATGSIVSFGAFAGGNGSGNPNNAGGSTVKITKPPLFVWQDYKLVKNPDASSNKEIKPIVKQ